MMYSTSSILCCMDTTYDFLSHVSNQEEEIERRATEQVDLAIYRANKVELETILTG